MQIKLIMSQRAVAKLVAASDAAAISQVQHLLVVLSADGQLEFSGSNTFINTLQSDETVFFGLQELLLSKKVEGNIKPCHILNYPLLPCSPLSPSWKGSHMISAYLTSMLTSTGHGGNGVKRKLGTGISPPGWPAEVIEWKNYKGATRSKLSTTQMTTIIVSLLAAAGIVDLNTHVKEDKGEEEDIEQNDVDVEQNVVEEIHVERNEQEHIGEKVEEEVVEQEDIGGAQIDTNQDDIPQQDEAVYVVVEETGQFLYQGDLQVQVEHDVLVEKQGGGEEEGSGEPTEDNLEQAEVGQEDLLEKLLQDTVYAKQDTNDNNLVGWVVLMTEKLPKRESTVSCKTSMNIEL